MEIIGDCYVRRRFCTGHEIIQNDAVHLPPGSIPWGIRYKQRVEGRVERNVSSVRRYIHPSASEAEVSSSSTRCTQSIRITTKGRK